MRKLRASGHKRMTWKNGGGETVEIAIFPPSASVNDFDWRISLATVASDGPFSIFPGIDRTLSILRGNGMALAINGQPPVRLETASLPFSFPADAPVDARLLDGPIADLNVMTRRGVFCHTVQRITGAFSADAGQEGIVILLSMAASVVRCGSEEQRLGPLDAVILDPAASFEIKAADAKDGYVIRLRRAGTHRAIPAS